MTYLLSSSHPLRQVFARPSLAQTKKSFLTVGCAEWNDQSGALESLDRRYLGGISVGTENVPRENTPIPLTDTAICAAKPLDKPQKLFDGNRRGGPVC